MTTSEQSISNLINPGVEVIIDNKPIPNSFEQEIELLKKVSTVEMITHGISLTMFEQYLEINGKGPHAKKQICYKDFITILNQGQAVPTAEIKGLLLPSNVIFISHNDKEIRMNCYYSAADKPLLYNSSKMEVKTPNIIISHKLNKNGKDWVTNQTRFFATDLPVSKLPKTFIENCDYDQRIFLFPFPNMYEQGNMCYGGNSMPARYVDDNLRGLDYYYKFLWETPFNDDLGVRGVTGHSGSKDWLNKLAKCNKDNTPFPYESLRGYKPQVT